MCGYSRYGLSWHHSNSIFAFLILLHETQKGLQGALGTKQTHLHEGWKEKDRQYLLCARRITLLEQLR